MKIWNRFVLQEEYQENFRDKYERFPYYLSSNRNIFIPEVSDHLYEKGFRPQYPGGKKFAACLSHDIDVLKQSPLQKLKNIVASSRDNIYKNIKNLSSGKIDAELDIGNIISLEKSFGATSSFYFLSLEKGDKDFNYSIESVSEQIRMITDAGSEVGLHGGHAAYDNASELAEELSRLEKALGKKISGYRGHYLRFSVPKTWEILAENEIIYDSTLGFSDCAGFRNGMCYPFRPFSLRTNSFIDLIEVPLIVMDASLFANMKLTRETAFELCVDLIEKVERVNGVFTILWHNNYFAGEFRDFYERILKLLDSKNAWLTSTENLVRHWKEADYTSQTESLLDRVIL